MPSYTLYQKAHWTTWAEHPSGSMHRESKSYEHSELSVEFSAENMTEARKEANNLEDAYERAKMYSDKIKNYFEEIRYCVDKLELMVDDDEWPLPKYRELLLIR